MPDRACRLVTWNVHGFVGSDGAWNPQNVAEVLAGLEPDLVALQEVDARPWSGSSRHPLDLLASNLDAKAVGGPTLGEPGNDYGNAVLSRIPIVDVVRHDLSRPGVEPRGAVDVRALIGDHTVRFVAIHLGLLWSERVAQATRLAKELRTGGRDAHILAVAGDLNAWWPRAREARIIEHAVGPSPKPRTFPSRRPLFRLDRIFVRPLGAVVDWGVGRNARIRAASDHLPVWVDVDVGALQGRDPE